MLSNSIIHQISKDMAEATGETLADLRAGDIGDENDFSSQLCARIKAKVNDRAYRTDPHLRLPGPIVKQSGLGIASEVRISARHLTWRGAGSEEHRLGADIAMVLDSRIEGYRRHSTPKGVLIQVKKAVSGDRFDVAEPSTLVKQCRDMATVTAASFALIYNGHGTRLVSAASVIGADGRHLGAVPTFSTLWFYRSFVTCWIGDVLIGATDEATLGRLLEERQSRNGLLISATEYGIG